MGESAVQWLADSTYSLKVVGSNLVSSKILDGNGFKSIPGFIPAPNSSNFIFWIYFLSVKQQYWQLLASNLANKVRKSFETFISV
jgi:hypothetical protein